MKQLLLDVAPGVVPSFANFVIGANQQTVTALRAVLGGERRERFMYLFGPLGSGKSHLLQAAVAERGAQRARYCACDAQTRLPLELAQLELVAVDEVERLTADAQVDLFHLFNEMRVRNRILLCAAEPPPGSLKLRRDLATRLASTLALNLVTLTDAEKARALRQHAQERGMRLGDEVIEFLLRHWRRDMPALLGALDALDAYSLETQRPITVPLLKQAIGL